MTKIPKNDGGASNAGEGETLKMVLSSLLIKK